MTYAAARAAAADALHPGTGGLLRTPNNILGIEYCKAILHRHAALTPLALPRLGAAHGGRAGAHAGTPMASASFLRGLPQPDWEPFVPPARRSCTAGLRRTAFAGRRKTRDRRSGPAADAGPREFCAGARRK